MPLALLACFGAALALPLGPAHAQGAGESPEAVRLTVINLIRALVDQGVLTVAKAQEMLRNSGVDPAVLAAPANPSPGAPAAASVEPPKPVVRVPFVPEVVKRELREEIQQEVLAQARAERWGDPGALPDWLSRISFHGDLRVRYQRDAFADGNDPIQNVDTYYQLPQGSTVNDTVARDRMRLRARLGLDAKVADEVQAGLRLTTSAATDTTSNPVSTNVDLGDANRRLGTALDLAFLRWAPLAQASVSAGRIANPYLASDLIWAPDLTLDGIAATYRPRLASRWEGFVTAGAHPLQSEQTSTFNLASDQWLYAAQGGVAWTGSDDSNFQLGLAYYDFSNVEGQLNPANPPGNALYSQTAPLFRQRGNTMFNIAFLSNPNGAPVYGVASKFKLLDLTTQFELARFDPVRLSLALDWVKNLGFNAGEISQRIGGAVVELPQDITGANGIARRRTSGYRYQFQVGRHELLQLGDWQAFGGYRYLERDAVLDAYTSQDYRLGGTDQKASFFGVNVGLAHNTSLTLRFVSAKSLDAPVKFDVDTWFLDFNGRF